ncbi:MAG: hypothetical protein Q7J31_04440 [Syntrophales bacterium]|nr:hypothetical protein [Syntrophales bacterium]
MGSWKIALADMLLLMLTIMIGLNSLMYFDSQSLNTTKVASKTSGKTGMSSITPAEIIVVQMDNQTVFLYGGARMALPTLVDSLQRAQVSAIILRGGRDTKLQWSEIVGLVSSLSKAGVKEVSYDIQTVESPGGQRQ